MADDPTQPRKSSADSISLSPAELEQRKGDTGRFEAKVVAGSRKPADDQTPSLAYLAVSVARAVARTAPRGQDPDAAMGTDRLNAAQQIEEIAGRSPKDAAPAAVLALKDLVHDVLRLRERAALLNSTAASAYSALNSTEHKLLELRSYLDRLFAAVARATPSPDAVLLDSHATHAERVGAAESALSGGQLKEAGGGQNAAEAHRLVLAAEQEAADARRKAQQAEEVVAHLRAELATAHQALSDTGAADRRVAEAEETAKLAQTARDEAEGRVRELAEELSRLTEERDRIAEEAKAQSEELGVLREAKRDSQALSDALARVGALEDELADAKARPPTRTFHANQQALEDSLARAGALEEQMFAEKEQVELRAAELAEKLAAVAKEREELARVRSEADAVVAASRALARGAETDEARARIKALEEQLAQRQRSHDEEVARLQGEHDERLSDASRRLVAAEAEAEGLRRTCADLQAAARGLVEERNTAQLAVEQAAAAQRTAEAAVAAARAELAAAQERLTGAAEADTLQRQAAAAEQQEKRAGLERRLAEAEAELAERARTASELQEGIVRLQEARSQAEQREVQAQQARVEAEQARDQAERELATVREDLTGKIAAARAEGAAALSATRSEVEQTKKFILEMARGEAEKAVDNALAKARAEAEAAIGGIRADAQQAIADARSEAEAARRSAEEQVSGMRAETAATLERQISEIEQRRTEQAAEYERRLAEAEAEAARQRAAAEQGREAARLAGASRVRLAEAAAAAHVRLGVASEEAGLEAVPAVLRSCADSLRAMPPDGQGDDTDALAGLDAAATAIVGMLASAQRNAALSAAAAAEARAEAANAEQRAQLATTRAESAETRARDAESRSQDAESAAARTRDEAARLAGELATRSHALDTALAEAAAAAATAASSLSGLRQGNAELETRLAATIRERDDGRTANADLTARLAAAEEAAGHLHGLLAEIAVDAGAEVELLEGPLAATSEGTAAEAAAHIRRRLADAAARLPALARDLAAAEQAHRQAVARAEAAERELADTRHSRDATIAERDAARGEASSLAAELVAARETLSMRNTELTAAREQLAVLDTELERARPEVARIPMLLGEITAMGRARDNLGQRLKAEGERGDAAEAAVEQLLSAARTAAAAAAAALDRFGLLEAGDSKRLTRATTRLDQATDGVAAAAGLGGELLERAAQQVGALADRYKEVDLERLALRDRGLALEADLASARAAISALEERVAASEKLAAQLPGAQARIAELESEVADLRGRLAEAVRAAELERRQAAMIHAATVAEGEARLESARAETAEVAERARANAEQAEMAKLAAEDASTRLASLEAETAARLAAAEAGMAERDQRIAELGTALDQYRADRGEMLGLSVRLRALDQRLAETLRDNARLLAERNQPAGTDPSTLAALKAAEHRAKGLEAALAEERVRAEALVRARERAANEWQLRFEKLHAELAADRNRLADLETALAAARAELAGSKARLRSLTSSEQPR